MSGFSWKRLRGSGRLYFFPFSLSIVPSSLSRRLHFRGVLLASVTQLILHVHNAIDKSLLVTAKRVLRGVTFGGFPHPGGHRRSGSLGHWKAWAQCPDFVHSFAHPAPRASLPASVKTFTQCEDHFLFLLGKHGCRDMSSSSGNLATAGRRVQVMKIMRIDLPLD